jgi:hypothetical protein
MNGKAIRFVLFASVLGLCLVSALPLRAQVAGGTLSGTVTDAQGAAVPNAKVAATNSGTNVSIDTTTNASGAYTLSNLIPGDYDVSATAAGFSKVVSKVTLTVGAKQEMNFSMKIGQVQQVVEVTGVAPQVELESSTLSGVVESAQIVELPLNGRDWAALATLEPGVVQVRTQEVVTQPGGQNRGLGMQMAVDGNRPTQNVYRLNGVIVNDYSNAGPGNVLGANMGVDAVQEFSVLTTNYTAEYGFTSGGVINAVTKSGTNQIHGSAYEFLRNSSLDAADYFENLNGLKKGQFRRNQFGASAGGPIKKGKIFVFGDYEGLRQSKGITVVSHTLSPNARLGILNDSNGNPLPALTTPCPYANSQNLAPGRAAVCVDNTVAALVKGLDPLPNSSLVGPDFNVGNYAIDGKQTVSDNYFTLRGDVKISEKDSLNASWYRDHSTWAKPDELDNLTTGFLVPHQSVSVEESHVFSPAWVNTVRLGYNQSNLKSPGIAAINPAANDTSFGMLPSLTAPGIGALGGSSGVAGLTGFGGFSKVGGFAAFTETIQAYDDAAYTFGQQSLKFGFMFIRNHDNRFDGAGTGSVSFSSLSNFLVNIPNKVRMPTIPPFTPGGDVIHHNRASIFAGYLQDDWKMRPNLTLNLGLRYEMSTIPTETQDKIELLQNIWTNPGNCIESSQGFANCNGFYTKTFQSNPTTKNFEPRVGFAWDPFRTGKTSVRGGFGLFDVLPLPYMIALNALQTAPVAVEVDLSSPGQGTFPHGLAAIALATPQPTTKRWNYLQPNPKRNYVMQWNFNVQRQVTPSTAVTLAYAGSRALHNPFQTDELNTVFPYQVNVSGIGAAGTSRGWLFPNPVGSGCLPGPPPNCSATDVALGLPANFSANPTRIVPGLLINPNTALIQSTAWISQAWYQSFQANVVKRMSHGLQAEVSFTWQKSLDTSSGSFAGDNYSADITPTIPYWDLRIIKGPADFNVARNLVINTVWDVPTGSLSGPLTWVAKGWQLGGILELSDGVPIWPLDGIEGDPSGQLNGEPMAIPDLAPGCTPKNAVQPGKVQYIKPQCFINAVAPSRAFYNAPAPLGCDKSFAYPTCINLLGNLGRNSLTGPALFNIDFSTVKDTHVTRISETFDVQFRAELFNALNHPNFAPPVNNLEALSATGTPVPGFGLIDHTQTPGREIQFALKLIW